MPPIIMKLKHLEYSLSSLPNRVFPNPKIALEQYPTSVHLTSSIALTALSKNDAGPGTTILDLGCGTGMLGLGFALVRSDLVYLVDCDPEALELAQENVDFLLEEELIGRIDEEGDEKQCCNGVELIMAKVKHMPAAGSLNGGKEGGKGRGGRGRKGRSSGGRGKGRGGRGSFSSAIPSLPQQPQSSNLDAAQNDSNNNNTKDYNDGIPLPSKIVDTVITNPPFGTKNNEGIDVQFLRTGIRLARRAVYSFHKTSTRPYLIKLLRDTWGMNVEVVAEMKFDIPNMYKFHKQKCVDVEVDLIRVFWNDENLHGSVTQSNNVSEAGNGDKNSGLEDGNADEEEDVESEGDEMPLGLCGHA
ncbi:hypothetical protein ACHAXS_013733 [Conticribra weissflogii]